jgi:transcriptional regulator GlxA family with amidase domain
MIHVSILLLHNANLASMDNARQGFIEVNNFIIQQNGNPVFNIELIGIEPVLHLNKGLYTVKPNKLINEVSKTDIIIIPPVTNSIEEALQLNSPFNEWIRKQYKHGAKVVSLCVGAFILAGTGLLNGKPCVTHWRATNDFRKAFPQVNLLTDKIVTENDSIYTGGGAFSSANLILYIIEKMVSREAAIYAAKTFQIDIGRNSQSPFTIFKGQKDHPDDQIIEVQQYIEENYENKITVDKLCDTYGIGRRTFERRFKRATGNTIVEYIQRVKIEAAKRALENGNKTVTEVMFEVGYSDNKAFRDIFKRYAGISPSDYRNRYAKSLYSNSTVA